MADLNEELVQEAIKKAVKQAEANEAVKKPEVKTEGKESKAEAAKQERTSEEKPSEDTPSEEKTSEEKTLEKQTTENEESPAEEDAEAAENSETETDSDSEGQQKKKSFFSKKDKKDKKDEKIDELNDRLLRNLAEFENFRKRTDKEKSQMFELGERSIVEKILPTIDNFERGLASLSEADKESPFAQGVEKIYKQLLTTLSDAGLKQIEAKGAKFDPNLHNAVMHEDNEELEENVVSEEFQKGYTFKDTVVRHSMVKVAN